MRVFGGIGQDVPDILVLNIVYAWMILIGTSIYL